MKMRRSMISKVHLDDYAVEAAYGRHRSRVMGHKVFVNPALVWLSVWFAIPTATTCQGEKHASKWPMHNALDPYNIELSCAAESKPQEPQQTKPNRTSCSLRRQLQRLVRTQRVEIGSSGRCYPMNLATDVLKIPASLIAMFLLIGRMSFSMFETNCLG